jgi:superfamily II DNA/RNA helicase
VREFAWRRAIGAGVVSRPASLVWLSPAGLCPVAHQRMHTGTSAHQQRATAAAQAASNIAQAKRTGRTTHTDASTSTPSADVVRTSSSASNASKSFASSQSAAIPRTTPAVDSSDVAPFTSILPEGIAAALAAQGLTHPTPIQSVSLPVLLSKRHVLLASQTGSGKTLAYLLPLLINLRRDEEAGVLARLHRPRAVIVVPNRELAIQILSVCKSLSGARAGRFRSFASTGFIPLRKLTRALEAPIDLLVVTPGRLEFLLSSNRISLTDTRYVVLDETDTLLAEEQGFREGVERTLLQPMKHRIEEAQKKRDGKPLEESIPPVQMTFCSASISTAIESYIRKNFPGVVRVHTPSLHHLPPSLLLRNILVKGEDKKDVLWKLLEKESASYKQRLMHHRTREQNQAELAACGGDEAKWWDLVVRQDVEKRLGGSVPATAAEIQIRNQLKYEEDAQDEMRVVTEIAPQSTAADDAEDRSDPDHPSHHQDSADAPADSAASPKALQLPLPPTLIFCNTVSCCRAVAWFLTEQGLNVGHYHGLMPAHYRTMHFKNFLSGHTSVLVCTDLASRGLDTTFVQHTIHFDYPLQVLDFLHRVGRTARQGRKGKSTALLGKRDRVMADAIERLVKQGLSIEQVTADKAKYGSDGLPLSRDIVHAAAPSPSGPRVLAPARGTAPVTSTGRPKSAPLAKGAVPRRRWMRYLSPTERNSFKLLYSWRPPPGMGEKQPTVRQLRRKEEKQEEYADMGGRKARERVDQQKKNTKRAKTDEKGEPTRADPFAFSAPPQFQRRTPPPKRDTVNAPPRFPSAATAGRRPAISRPLGPLAHKQRVGAIFAAPASKKPDAPKPAGGQSATSGASKKRRAFAKMSRSPSEFAGNKSARLRQAMAVSRKETAKPGREKERAFHRRNSARKGGER